MLSLVRKARILGKAKQHSHSRMRARSNTISTNRQMISASRFWPRFQGTLVVLLEDAGVGRQEEDRIGQTLRQDTSTHTDVIVKGICWTGCILEEGYSRIPLATGGMA